MTLPGDSSGQRPACSPEQPTDRAPVSVLRLGHLPPDAPGLQPADLQWRTLHFSAHGQSLDVELPLLSDEQMQALAGHVRKSARERLQPMPVDTIIDVIDRSVARLLDSQDPLRRLADDSIPIVTGFDAEMVRQGLTSCLQTYRGPQLQRFVAQDFSNPKVLDSFQPAIKGGAMRAFGPALLAHLWAGNVPGLPLWSLACGLLVKAGNIGKLPSAEPVFATLFVQALCETHPPLADCLSLVWWKGGQIGPGATLCAQAETVLAYGSNAALGEIRELVPATTRFIGYGHKLGVALVGRAALDRERGPEAARRAARDMVRWEQQGCYSPHAVYVERGGALSPGDFAQHLAAELANSEHRHPRRALGLDESQAVAAWRRSAEWRALRRDDDAGGGASELMGDAAATWSVVFSATPQPLSPSPGQRCVQVSAVDTLDDAMVFLAPHSAFLQTVALATTPAQLYRLSEALGRIGVTRIAALGAMTQPEAGWHHDGRFSVADLVRIVDIDQAAERYADRMAPYVQEADA